MFQLMMHTVIVVDIPTKKKFECGFLRNLTWNNENYCVFLSLKEIILKIVKMKAVLCVWSKLLFIYYI